MQEWTAQGMSAAREKRRSPPCRRQPEDHIPEWRGREESSQGGMCPSWWQRPEGRNQGNKLAVWWCQWAGRTASLRLHLVCVVLSTAPPGSTGQRALGKGWRDGNIEPGLQILGCLPSRGCGGFCLVSAGRPEPWFAIKKM